MIRVLSADDARRVHLHGVGDVARPVDIDTAVTGLTALKSLRIYRFLPGQVIDGEAEGDEVCILFLAGRATFEVDGDSRHRWDIPQRADAFGSDPPAFYLPPHHRYRLTAHAPTEVAYARAAATGAFPPRSLGEGDSALLGPSDAERLRCAVSTFTESRVLHLGGDGEHFYYCRFEGQRPARLLAGAEPLTLNDRDTVISQDEAFMLELPPTGCALLLHFFVADGN